LTSQELKLLNNVAAASRDKPLDHRFRLGDRAFRAWLAEAAPSEPIVAEFAEEEGDDVSEQLAVLRAHAIELLESAHEELAKNMGSLFRRRFLKETDVAGVLALSRLRFLDGNVKESQALLEHRVYGPLTLSQADHKIILEAFSPTLEQDILDHAVRLYRFTNQLELLLPVERQLAHILKNGPRGLVLEVDSVRP
jgi:hypothetical protein